MTLTAGQERTHSVNLVTEGVPLLAIKGLLETPEEKYEEVCLENAQGRKDIHQLKTVV